MDYLDFDLEIGQDNEQEYSVAVVSSPAGEAHVKVLFPFDEQALKDRLKNLQLALFLLEGGSSRILLKEKQTVQDFGQQLFDAFISGEVRDRYDMSRSHAIREGKSLRLRLHIQVPKLIILPWEYLYDARQAKYVFLSGNTSIIRLGRSQNIRSQIVTPPLRILVMIASPRDKDPLDIEYERSLLQESIKALVMDGLVEAFLMNGQTQRDLEEAMRSNTWHIFHFIGYGGCNLANGESFIDLVGEDGKTHQLIATELARILKECTSLQLVLLKACEGIQDAEPNNFSNTAAILTEQGIPTVLAMQSEVRANSMTKLLSTFYGALIAGMSVTNAREKINQEMAETSAVWGVPVLFTCLPNDRLIDFSLREGCFPPLRLGVVISALLFIVIGLILFLWSIIAKQEVGVQLLSGLLGFLGLIGLVLQLSFPQWFSPSQTSIRQQMTDWFKSLQLKGRWLNHQWHKFRPSRRDFLAGLGLTGLGLGLGLWIGKSTAQQVSSPPISSSHPSPKPTPISPKPTPFPLGTTLSSTAAETSVAWSPDGTRIASGTVDGTVIVRDATAGSIILTYRSYAGSVHTISWSPDGQRIASGNDDGTVQVWNATTKDVVLTYKGHFIGGGPVYAVAWSPNGKYIASSALDKTVRVWNATNGETLHYDNVDFNNENSNFFSEFDHKGPVYTVSWSPDGQFIASGSADGTVQIWNVRTGYRIFIYRGHSIPVHAVAWSSNNKRIASGGDDKTVQVWDVATNGGNILAYHGHADSVTTISWSPDGKRIASGSDDKTVQVWNIGNILTYHGYSWPIAWSPDSKRIASSNDGETVQIWDATTGHTILTYEGHSDAVNAVAWSPTGQFIASGSNDKTVQVWDNTNGHTIYTYHGHSAAVNSVAWSPDGQRITSTSDDETVQVWDATTGGTVLTYKGHNGRPVAAAWSPDGRRISSASDDETVQVWDATSGRHVTTYKSRLKGVQTVTWSADGNRIASDAGRTLEEHLDKISALEAWDVSSALEVWDATSGHRLYAYFGYNDGASGAAWSPDGQHIALANDFSTIQLLQAI